MLKPPDACAAQGEYHDTLSTSIKLLFIKRGQHRDCKTEGDAHFRGHTEAGMDLRRHASLNLVSRSPCVPCPASSSPLLLPGAPRPPPSDSLSVSVTLRALCRRRWRCPRASTTAQGPGTGRGPRTIFEQEGTRRLDSKPAMTGCQTERQRVIQRADDLLSTDSAAMATPVRTL